MKRLNPAAVRWLVVHTAGHFGDASAAEIRRWHTDPRPKGNGWDDIGYHFVIRKDGALEVGRSLEHQGAHCLGINARSIGVVCSGHGDAQPLTGPQVGTLVRLAVRLHHEYGVQVDGLIGHREVNRLVYSGAVAPEYVTTKSCPGRRVHMPALRRMFDLELNPPPPELARAAA